MPWYMCLGQRNFFTDSLAFSVTALCPAGTKLQEKKLQEKKKKRKKMLLSCIISFSFLCPSSLSSPGMSHFVRSNGMPVNTGT